MNVKEIMEIIPHRYPFLLLDRVESIEGNKIIAKKNVTMNEKMMICLIKSGASINLTLHLHDVIAVNSKLLHHQFQY